MDLESLQEIPGYRAILKSVLKAQIQLLMEQLSSQAGEESIILTASIQDGSLSHLGSNTGKGFLEGRDEIKAQFLGYCLKNQHSGQEADPVPYQKSRTLLPPSRRPRPRIRPSPYGIPSPGNSPPQFGLSGLGSPYHMSPAAAHSQSLAVGGVGGQGLPGVGGHANSIRAPLKQDNTVDNFLDSVSKDSAGPSMGMDGQSFLDTAAGLGEEGVEGVVQGEGALEEGNELEDKEAQQGDASDPQTPVDWQNNIETAGDRSVVKMEKDDANIDDPASHHLGGIAFPGLDNAHHDFSKSLAEMSAAELKHVLYPQGNQLSHSPLLPYENMSLQPKGRTYWCHFCHKSLQNKTLYEYHVRAHSGVKPYQCEVCHRKFAGKQVLETHMRLHSGERPFKCTKPGCDRAFTARSGLVYHVNKHHV